MLVIFLFYYFFLSKKASQPSPDSDLFITLTQRAGKSDTFRWRRIKTISFFFLSFLKERMGERKRGTANETMTIRWQRWRVTQPQEGIKLPVWRCRNRKCTGSDLPADLLLITTVVIEILKQRSRVFVIGICPLSAVNEVHACSFNHPKLLSKS